MNANEPMSVGGSYALSLLNDWLDIKTKSTEFREKMLAKEADSVDAKRIARDFIAMMTVLWGELRPKVEGRNDGQMNKEFSDEFMGFSQYYYNPNLLLAEEHADNLFKMQSILRAAIERLRITVYD